VAGARAFQSALDPPGGEREPLHEVAQSDASGWLVVTLPMGSERDFDWVNYPWLVTAPGLAPLGHIERFPVPRDHDPAVSRTREAPAATLRLRPGIEVRGRLADCPGGTLLHVRTRVASTGSSIRPTILPLPTAADGTFSVVLDDRFGGAILACPDGETLSRRNTGSETPIAPVIVLAVIPPARGKPVDLGTIRLGDLLALDLRALPREGSVAESPTVALGLAGKEGPQTLVRGIATDRLGRSRLLVPATEGLIVAAWTSRAFGMAEPVLGQGEASCTVTLADATLLPGSVRDAAGRPVPDARVVFWLWSNDPAHANAFLAQAIHVLEPRTDDEGRFELMLLPGVTQSFTAVHTGKGEHFLQGIEPFIGDRAPERLDLQLGR
jgi:hypothetical protein